MRRADRKTFVHPRVGADRDGLRDPGHPRPAASSCWCSPRPTPRPASGSSCCACWASRSSRRLIVIVEALPPACSILHTSSSSTLSRPTPRSAAGPAGGHAGRIDLRARSRPCRRTSPEHTPHRHRSGDDHPRRVLTRAAGDGREGDQPANGSRQVDHPPARERTRRVGGRSAVVTNTATSTRTGSGPLVLRLAATATRGAPGKPA